MTEAEKYYKEKTKHIDNVNGYRIVELMQSYADEQVKKANKGDFAFDVGYKQGKRETIEQIEKSLPSDEEIETFIDNNYRYPDGTKMLDFQTFYEGIKLQRNKTKEAINKIKIKII